MSLNVKLDIRPFDGKNWQTWKFQVMMLLRTHAGALDAVQGNLKEPTHPGDTAKAEDLVKYRNECDAYQRIDSTAFLLLTTNMTEKMLTKVMRFTTAKEAWDELNRLYERESQDRFYDVCMQFFGYKYDPSHDIGTHLTTVKNLWHEINLNMAKKEKNDLPEMLLICKVMDSLPNEYFNFKSSWALMSVSEHTIENLTTQLCAYERSLNQKEIDESDKSNDLLMVKSEKRYKTKTKNKLCNYCKEGYHKVKSCKKWIADGRPPKPPKQSTINVAMLTSIVLACGDKNADKNSWYVDNGATSHVTNRGDLFQSFELFDQSHKVMTANGEMIEAIGKGSIQLQADVKGRQELVTLTNVWYIPSIQRNLFSVLAAQDKMNNSIFQSTGQSCYVKNNGKIILVGNRDKYGNLYKLNVKVLKPKLEINQLTMSQNLQLYHERLGHQNKRHVAKLIQRELGVKLDSSSSDVCEGCVFGKSHRQKFGERPKATKAGELISTDVCGPFPYSISKFKYYVLFKDTFSKYRWIYFLKQKSEVHGRLKEFLAEVKTSGHILKELLSDNGGEFDNEQVRNTLRQFGIKQRLTMPYTPQQNGSAERENRTIVEMTRALMHAHDEIPKGLWAEISKTSVYILNRTGPTFIDGKSPYELWYNRKPKINHLKIVGCDCFVHIPKQKRSGKLNRKAEKGIFIGYDGDEGYRVFDVKNLKLIRSRDIVFDEIPLLEKNKIDKSVESPRIKPRKSKTYELPVPSTSSQINNKDNVQSHPHSETNESDGDFQSIEDDETDGGNDVTRQDIEDTPIVEINRRQLRDRSQIKPPERFNFEQFISEAISVPEPSSYREVLRSPEKEKWFEAMNSEINSLKENQTWELTNLPKNRKALQCKWVFKIKRNPDGTVDKYKARLVAVGYSQKKGIDYDKTFSPVAKMSTIRVLLSIAANEGLALKQFDVSTAFLYGSVKEEIYLRQPEGYDDGTGRVCKLKRSLYGLKQAPKCWNECIHYALIDMGFTQSEADPCLYVRERGAKKLLLGLYVDDGLLAASDEEEADSFIENELKSRFKITTKPPSYFLGLEIERLNDGTIKVHQAAYTRKLLEKYGMSDCKVVGTPIIKDSENGMEEKDNDNPVSFPYRQAVGSLAYLMVGTRPDIAYAVGVVSRTLDKPTKKNIQQVKRIFRYLKGTIDVGLEYKKSVKRLVCYSDADHGGDETSGCSTSGILCLFGSSAISWRSVKQASVALSSTEAEIVAASEACREIVWLKRLFQNLKMNLNTPILRIDNESAIKLAHNPPYEQHRKTKHIKLKHFYVRECVSEKIVMIEQVPTSEQLADVLTKPVYKPRLLNICEQFGLK